MGWLKNLDEFVEGVITPGAPEPSAGGVAPAASGDQSAINDVAKWLAAAFTLLASILTFIGVEEGTLTRLLRNEPGAALLVFVYIGAAVTLGVVTPALPDERRLRLGVVVLTAAAVLIVASVVLPDLTETVSWTLHVPLTDRNITYTRTAWLIIAATLLAVVLALTLWHRPIGVKTAALAIGIFIFTIGMYGAFKISVRAEAAKDRPSVTAEFVSTDDGPAATVTVTARGMLVEEHVLTRIYGVLVPRQAGDFSGSCEGDKACDLIYAYRVGGNEAGVVDKTVSVPLRNTSYHQIFISALLCAPVSDDGAGGTINQQDNESCNRAERLPAFLEMRIPWPQEAPAVSVAWGEAQQEQELVSGTVTVTANGIGPHRQLNVRVFSRRQPKAKYKEVAASFGSGTTSGDLSVVLPISVPKAAKSLCVTTEIADEPPESRKPLAECSEGGFGGTTVVVPVPH